MTAAQELLELLRVEGKTVATAESLTGGLVASALVDHPGASDVFVGGVVAYQNYVKTLTLAVPADVLTRRGAVDPEVAALMASGVAQRMGADVGVATTGVAGPGPEEDVPSGTVFVAATDRRSGVSLVRGLTVEGDRSAVRQAATSAALTIACDVVSEGLTSRGGRAQST